MEGRSCQEVIDLLIREGLSNRVVAPKDRRTKRDDMADPAQSRFGQNFLQATVSLPGTW